MPDAVTPLPVPRHRTLATELYTRMQAAGLDRHALARASGADAAALSRLFSGMADDLPAPDLDRMVIFFGVPPEVLLHGEEVATGANTLRTILAPATAPTTTGLALVPLAALRRSDRNPRKFFDPDALNSLADSIRAQGILQNLVVRYDPQPGQPDYVIVAGERRFRAASLLAAAGELDQNAAAIPVNILEADDARHSAIAIIENLHRRDVNPLEEAQGFADLIALDPDQWRPSIIAKEIGCSARHVQTRLALLEKLCEQAQELLRHGSLTVSQANVLATTSPQRQLEVLRHRDRYQTTQQWREAVTDGMVPATRAKFDVGTFGGTIVTLDNGTRYIPDRQEFLAWQRGAGHVMAMELAAEWSWAHFREDAYYPAADFKHEQTDDRSRGGALVLMHPVTGVITVHDGLIRKDSPASAAVTPPVPPKAPPTERRTELAAGLDRLFAAEQRAQEEAETAAFRAKLAVRVGMDSRTALAVLLTDALRHDSEPGLLNGGPGDDAGLPVSAIQGPLRVLQPFVRAIGRGRVAIADPTHAREVWRLLAGAPLVQLVEALTLWVAAQVQVSAVDELADAWHELARAHAIPVPAHLRPGSVPDECADLVDRAHHADTPPDTPPGPAEDATPAPAPAAPAPRRRWSPAHRPGPSTTSCCSGSARP
ncbi:ParB/RepB/Spo0J family partition protein [Azospirillum argentinense]|uniref:ParB/RepB/Spo0J family partition protein n=1 Tax=Azospirillum brasilense TaxID=192 RepID=A0A4D8QL35_AZOBR|nr:ParB/RepB/Spo0J family partition protein [Azospirillum argentinense]QCO07559.1 ParB/RepB/Spo0J family partition protein [Azospirillum argentinense]